jgi:hypothetical protein
MSGLEPELVDLMLDAAVIEPQIGIDKFNNFSYGDPISVRCQIARTNKRALDKAGRETISTVQVILADPTLVVTVDDRLTLSDGDQPAIVEVLSVKDDEGEYYLELRA